MAVDAVKNGLVLSSVFLLNHISGAAIGAEGADLIGKKEFRIVVITYDRVVFHPGLHPDSHVHDVIGINDAKTLHGFLKEIESLAAGRYDQMVEFDAAAVGLDAFGIGIHGMDGFTQRELGTHLFQAGNQFSYQFQTAVCPEMGLADVEKLGAQALSPTGIHIEVGAWKKRRVEYGEHLFQIPHRLFASPILRGETHGIGEIHLAVVPQTAGGVFMTIDQEQPEIASTPQ
jgi:hypothetical protein